MVNAPTILFLRNAFDLMRDSPRNALWLSDGRGDAMRPVALGFDSLSTPHFSPDGPRIAFVATPSNGKGAQLFVHWLASGDTVPITQPCSRRRQSLAWSRDGRQIAFLMRVPEKPEPIAKLLEKPEGATWAAEPRVVERLIWRRDGAGYVKPGYVQLFVLPADGGTARQLTEGPYAHGGEPAWLPGPRLHAGGNARVVLRHWAAVRRRTRDPSQHQSLVVRSALSQDGQANKRRRRPERRRRQVPR